MGRIGEAEDGPREERAARGPGGLAAGRTGLVAAARDGRRQGLFKHHQHEQASREHFQPDKPRLQEDAFGALQERAAEREPEAQAAGQFMRMIVRTSPGDENKAAQGVR